MIIFAALYKHTVSVCIIDDAALNTVTELAVDIVYGTLSAAVLLIVVVCGSVICALTVKVHRLRKHSESDQCGQPNAMLV